MGYSTDFYGALKLSRTATEAEKNYINLFSGTRRMKRDVSKLMELYKGEHGLPNFNNIPNRTPEQIYGNDGEYFCMDDVQHGQLRDDSIIDYNESPGKLEYDKNIDFRLRWDENERRIKDGKCQPGLWCQWVISEDGTLLEWDGGEKFYYYTEWLKYMISHFFQPWGIKLNGEIEWEGEDRNDRGKIVVKDNEVKIKQAKITFE